MSELKHLPPIKRVEGHGRVSLQLDAEGRVAAAHFDVTEFRGFEKFVEGRMVWEMPLITSRVCGICPVSHHVAAVKAVDDLLGVEIPRPAALLRELLQLAGFVHDHALHFFFLAGPDFLVGNGASRDLLGVLEGRPDLAASAIRLRKAGQAVVDAVGGQGHPVTAIPGGMSKPISAEEALRLRALVADALMEALTAEELAHECTRRLLTEYPGFAARPTPYLALLADGDRFSVYGGAPAFLASDGGMLDRFDASSYRSRIAERVVDHSYAKVPYLTSLGPEDGIYRVGPLARANMISEFGTPHADLALGRFRAELGRPVHETLAYHWARMIELVGVLERMGVLLDDPDIASADVRVRADRVAGVGVGIVEAPRGTLIHRYEADDVGRVTSAELIVATTHNNAAIDRTCAEALRGVAAADGLAEDDRLRLELGIRAYDPCLSCATHEVGRMPLVVDTLSATGELLGSQPLGGARREV